MGKPVSEGCSASDGHLPLNQPRAALVTGHRGLVPVSWPFSSWGIGVCRPPVPPEPGAVLPWEPPARPASGTCWEEMVASGGLYIGVPPLRGDRPCEGCRAVQPGLCCWLPSHAADGSRARLARAPLLFLPLPGPLGCSPLLLPCFCSAPLSAFSIPLYL